MNVTEAVSEYVKRMIGLTSVKGMKALILDRETSGIIGLIFSQSAILEENVFLVERIDTKTDENMAHLRAIVFVRPTVENISLLKGMLKRPQYSSFHIFFSNIVKGGLLRELAESDAFELVKEVHEYYADYFAISKDLFTLNMPLTQSLYSSQWSLVDQANFERIIDGLLSLALSLKVKPLIRYQASSALCERIARKVDEVICSQRDLFSFGPESSKNPPLLLILDRREDPVTPLLMQWTYRSMLHEVIRINNNRLKLRPAADGSVKEVVLSHDDAFYNASCLLNFGDLGMSIKTLVEEYQKKTKNDRQIDTIEDMQRFVEHYSDYLAESSTVAKHVALVTELSQKVEEHHLMELSAAQQSLACDDSHQTALRTVLDLIQAPQIHQEDKLRLVCLYALRYETDPTNDIVSMCSLLRDRSTDERFRSRVSLVQHLLRYAGSAIRTQDLFSQKDLLAKASSFLTRSGVKGVENIYTQHEPLLSRTIDAIRRQKLKLSDFPLCGVNATSEHSTKHVILFMVGGATYQEAACVAQVNAQAPNSNRFILGATHILNSMAFLDDIASVNSVPTEI